MNVIREIETIPAGGTLILRLHLVSADKQYEKRPISILLSLTEAEWLIDAIEKGVEKVVGTPQRR